jgi:hypothetical protein
MLRVTSIVGSSSLASVQLRVMEKPDAFAGVVTLCVLVAFNILITIDLNWERRWVLIAGLPGPFTSMSCKTGHEKRMYRYVTYRLSPCDLRVENAWRILLHETCCWVCYRRCFDMNKFRIR